MQELLIWAGGRWRRVYEDGRVEGWRRRGRLMLCRDGVIEEVSWERGLRTLVKGPELPLVRHENKDKKPTVKTMLVRDAGVQTDRETAWLRPHNENRAPVDVTTEHDQTDKKPSVKTRLLVQDADVQTARASGRTRQDKENRAPAPAPAPAPADVATERDHTDWRPEPVKIDREEVTTEARAGCGHHHHHQDDDGRISTNTTTTQSKELVIDEDDVAVFRRYIASHPSNVDVSRFDRDEHYRLHVFYTINPLVCVERCSEIAVALQRRFATQLGLRSIASSDRDRDRDRDRDQLDTHSDATSRAEVTHTRTRSSTRGLAHTADTSTPSSTSQTATKTAPAVRPHRHPETGPEVRPRVSDEEPESKRERRPLTSANTNQSSKTRGPLGKALRVKARPVHVPKRSSVSGGREYSSLEDLTIVSWLVASPERERMVNGNRLWRMLQSEFFRLTGQKRTWHSLRNRYLRYVLPALGDYAVEPHTARRLRAHAVLGELKSRKQRRSPPRPPRVLSASAAGRAPPRTPRPRTPRSPTPPPRRSTLRPRPSPRPSPPPAPRTPRTQPASASAPASHESPQILKKRRRLYNPA